jgi:hypothetical protein
LIDNALRLGQDVRVDSSLAELDRLAQGTKMIDKMGTDILAVEQTETPADHYRNSSRG